MSHTHILSLKRKSIRKYAKAKIDPEALKEILEIGLRAPTSCNSKATRFILVEDQETLSKLGEARKHGSKFLASAAVAIVVAVDLNKAHRPEADTAVAAAMMQLAITDLELGSCWCHIADCRRPDGSDSEAYVKELLGIPPSIGVLCILGVGLPENDEDLAYRDLELNWGRVSLGEFSEPEELISRAGEIEDGSRKSCTRRKERE